MNTNVEESHNRLDEFVLSVDTAPIPKDFTYRVMDQLYADHYQGVIGKMMWAGQQSRVQLGFTLIGLLLAANRLLRFIFGAWLFASVAY